jgi:hypothetical protein
MQRHPKNDPSACHQTLVVGTAELQAESTGKKNANCSTCNACHASSPCVQDVVMIPDQIYMLIQPLIYLRVLQSSWLEAGHDMALHAYSSIAVEDVDCTCCAVRGFI